MSDTGYDDTQRSDHHNPSHSSACKRMTRCVYMNGMTPSMQLKRSGTGVLEPSG